MSDLITDEIFTDGQKNIAATNMNGIVGRARVQPDVIASKVPSATMDVADQILVLKTDNTLARARFDTIVSSTGSALALANTSQNGMLRQVSGVVSDYVGGDNQCHPLSSFLPPGVVVDYAGPTIPTSGWLKCDGASYLRTTYPGLYAAIGTTYGSVDGTHFNVPNYQGKILAGAGAPFSATLGATGGAATVALAIGNLPSHAHSITDILHGHTVPSHTHSASDSGHTHAISGNAATIGVTGGASNIAYFGTTTTGVGNANITVAPQGAFNTTNNFSGITGTAAVGSGTAFSILPPYQTAYKLIKT